LCCSRLLQSWPGALRTWSAGTAIARRESTETGDTPSRRHQKRVGIFRHASQQRARSLPQHLTCVQYYSCLDTVNYCKSIQ
jgi:hypothetical protein